MAIPTSTLVRYPKNREVYVDLKRNPGDVTLKINNRIYYRPLDEARALSRKWGGSITTH